MVLKKVDSFEIKISNEQPFSNGQMIGSFYIISRKGLIFQTYYKRKKQFVEREFFKLYLNKILNETNWKN